MKDLMTTAQSTTAMRRWGPPGIVALAAAVALTALTPSAEAAKQARQPAEAMAPREAGEPIMAIVSIKSQQVTFYDSDGWILRAPVSTGTTGRETPAGVFAIVEKDKDHHSTMYDDAWMPNMQRITWNGIALHGGPLPGYAASHGCVRMPFDFAEGLFDKTQHRHAGDHLAERRGAGRFLSSLAVRAEARGHRGRAGPCRQALRRSRGGHPALPTRPRRLPPRPRRRPRRFPRRCASWNSRRPAPTPSSPSPTSRSRPPRPIRPGRRPRS